MLKLIVLSVIVAAVAAGGLVGVPAVYGAGYGYGYHAPLTVAHTPAVSYAAPVVAHAAVATVAHAPVAAVAHAPVTTVAHTPVGLGYGYGLGYSGLGYSGLGVGGLYHSTLLHRR